MAMIIDLPAAAARASSSRLRSGASAEIVFFPGVRYERAEPDAATAKERASKTKRRDKLELED